MAAAVSSPDRKVAMDAQLFAAVDAALQPAGMLSDLSRIIAQFARPIRWAANERLTLTDPDGDGSTVTFTKAEDARWLFAVSEVPIRQYPISTAGSSVDAGTVRRDGDIPYCASYREAAGSLYHFTADLSTGTLRVRPVVTCVHRDYRPRDPTQTEWTIAEGIADLAERGAAVSSYIRQRSAVFTLLC
jgi:hypothetical protein